MGDYSLPGDEALKAAMFVEPQTQTPPPPPPAEETVFIPKQGNLQSEEGVDPAQPAQWKQGSPSPWDKEYILESGKQISWRDSAEILAGDPALPILPRTGPPGWVPRPERDPRHRGSESWVREKLEEEQVKRAKLAALRSTDEYKRFFQANLKRLKDVDVLPSLPDWFTGPLRSVYGKEEKPIWGWSPYHELDAVYGGMTDADRIRKMALAEALVGAYAQRGMSDKVTTYLDQWGMGSRGGPEKIDPGWEEWAEHAPWGEEYREEAHVTDVPDPDAEPAESEPVRYQDVPWP
jgi:hypothetical protein